MTPHACTLGSLRHYPMVRMACKTLGLRFGFPVCPVVCAMGVPESASRSS